jgi:hypothetical protein
MINEAAMKNTDWLEIAKERCKDIRNFPLSDEDCKRLDHLRCEMFESDSSNKKKMAHSH